MLSSRWSRFGLFALGLIALALGAFATASAGAAPAHVSAVTAVEYA